LFHQGDKLTEINLSQYAESLKGYRKMRNVQTGESFNIPDRLNLDANASVIFELLP